MRHNQRFKKVIRENNNFNGDVDKQYTRKNYNESTKYPKKKDDDETSPLKKLKTINVDSVPMTN